MTNKYTKYAVCLKTVCLTAALRQTKRAIYTQFDLFVGVTWCGGGRDVSSSLSLFLLY